MKKFKFTLKHELLLCLLLTIAIAAIYGQTINHEFVSFDDLDYVVENSYVQQGLTIDGLKWAFSFQNKMGTYWHPLTWLSHMVDVSMFGNQAGYHHLVNIIWHVFNTCLLFLLLHRITRMFWFSAIVAALFAVHPLNVETVAWISERKNLLSTFFLLLSISAYIYYTRNSTFIKYAILVLIYTAGLLAKPMLVTLPFVLLLLDYWPLKRVSLQSFSFCSFKQIASCILEKIPLIGLAFLVSYLIMHSLEGHNNVIAFSKIPLSLRVENVLVSYLAYIGKAIWPFNLAVYYPFPKALSILQITISALLLGCISFAIIGPLRGSKQLTVGWLWFLGTLVPVSGIIQAGLWPAMADRWTYVPFIGLFIIFAWLTKEFVNRQNYSHKVSLLITILIIMMLGPIAWRHVGYWKNSDTLFSHILEVNPNNFVAHNNVGSGFAKKGQIEKAIGHFYEALSVLPDSSIARTNLVYLLDRSGRTGEAKKVYEEGVRLQPNAFDAVINQSNISPEQKSHEESVSYITQYLKLYPKDKDAHFKIAQELTIIGRLEKAIEHYHQVLIVESNHLESLNNIAMLLDRIGENDSAISYFRRALSLAPKNADIHYNFAYSLAKAGRKEEAEKHFTMALELNPDFVNAHNNLGILLAQQNRTEQAISHFKQALIIDPSSVNGHTNMGIILLNLGKMDDAGYHLQEALRLNPKNKKLLQLLLLTGKN